MTKASNPTTRWKRKQTNATPMVHGSTSRIAEFGTMDVSSDASTTSTVPVAPSDAIHDANQAKHNAHVGLLRATNARAKTTTVRRTYVHVSHRSMLQFAS